MARIRGSKNRHRKDELVTTQQTPAQRIHYIANLIIDRIVEDQSNGRQLYKRITQVRSHG